MKNREIFKRDPIASKLLNDGVVAITPATTSEEIRTLQYELEHFVCEGQYQDGLLRILESYLGNAGSTVQPAAWVSGFYGSGKSHLLKMLQHLWVNTQFSDGSTARGLAQLTDEVKDVLKELDILGRRCGGLHAVAGKLSCGGSEDLCLAVLGMLFRSKGLPEALPQAKFCLWLQKNGIYEKVQKIVEEKGKDFRKELHDLYVSPVLAKALLEVDPGFAPDMKQVRLTLRTQFPVAEKIAVSEFILMIREVLEQDGRVPGTVFILDEIQLFIGDSQERSYHVQEVAEALTKQLSSRILLIGAGQTALAGNVPLLQRLKDRFTIPVELSDADVETVTRRVVLAKKADRRKAIEDVLAACAGETDRELTGTKIAPRAEDRKIIVEDYPILPHCRRFWEHLLRAVDIPGTSSQLRTQLRIVYDAARETAERELGVVTPADFIFEQLRPDLVRTNVLLREINETIEKLDDGTPGGKLAGRLCGLIFLIRKLPREPVADIGVRATSEMLADLLVSDLKVDGIALRREIPQILDLLVSDGKLMKLGDEYGLQTRESSEWEREFRNRQTRWLSDLASLSAKRSEFLQETCVKTCRSLKILQGKCREPRKLSFHFAQNPPRPDDTDIILWIRDGWGERENTVLSEARAAGSDSPIIFVYLSKGSEGDLTKAIIDCEAAQETVDVKGVPTIDEGKEAREAMLTRVKMARDERDRLIREVVQNAKVFQGGGQECLQNSLKDRLLAAAEAALVRMFPQFRNADDDRWPAVMKRAKNGDEAALQAVDYSGPIDRHPVCAAILSSIGAGKEGKKVRETFAGHGYGWPRDAVDAALALLFTAGRVRAVHKGKELRPGELDQAKIPVAEFKAEAATIDTPSRIKLRNLFQSAGLTCRSGEEANVAGEFLNNLIHLAQSAGGNPPLPEPPGIEHIEAIKAETGNAQLAAILAECDALKRQWQDWQKLAELAAQRRPAWETLQNLLRHAEGVSGAENVATEARAVFAERRLLNAADPVPALTAELAKILRSAVKKAHSRFADTCGREMENLTASEIWPKLSPEEQRRIFDEEGIAVAPEPSITDSDALLTALEKTPLSAWETMTDALPQRFANAKIAAMRLVDPQVRQIRLTSGALKTEKEVNDWIAATQKKLLEQLQQGPIAIA